MSRLRSGPERDWFPTPDVLTSNAGWSTTSHRSCGRVRRCSSKPTKPKSRPPLGQTASSCTPSPSPKTYPLAEAAQPYAAAFGTTRFGRQAGHINLSNRATCRGVPSSTKRLADALIHALYPACQRRGAIPRMPAPRIALTRTFPARNKHPTCSSWRI